MVETFTGAGIGFQLTNEQQMLQKMARDFAAREITPVAAEYDEQAIFPEAIFRKAFDIGLVNMNIPAEYGGVGASALEECLVAEELAYGCTGISTSLCTNNLAALPIILAGNERQKTYWLGDRSGGRLERRGHPDARHSQRRRLHN
jgi:acyl-CoA dehydrogenase